MVDLAVTAFVASMPLVRRVCAFSFVNDIMFRAAATHPGVICTGFIKGPQATESALEQFNWALTPTKPIKS